MKQHPKAFEAGVADSQARKPALLDEQEMRKVMGEFSAKRMEKMEAERKAKGEQALKLGKEFLSKNKTKPQVVTLASGLQYKVIKQGNGPKPTSSDEVRCRYRGTLIDGTEFDSNFNQEKPAEFAVSGVIRGWTKRCN